MSARHFLQKHFPKGVNRGKNEGTSSFFRNKRTTSYPWLWFIRDSVKEIEVRSTQTGHPPVDVIEDYLNECRPFLTENQINDLSNHLMNVFRLDEKPYF